MRPLRRSTFGRSGVVLIPLLAFVLALVASVAVVLVQQREAQDRSAQLTLASIEDRLNQLQGLPWQVENRGFGSPRSVRTQIAKTERSIDVGLAGLLRSSPVPPLRAARAALRANFAAQPPIARMGLAPGGWNDPVKTGAVAQTQTQTLYAALGDLDAANGIYARRARTLDWIDRIGVVATIAILFVAFLVYFRRSEKTRRRLSRQVRTDTLTGLANRPALAEGAVAQLSAPSAQRAAVLFIDLDGFKDINDVLGHRGGDAVLREVAVRLEQNTRSTDLCARLGGDEFAVVLYDADETVAESFARRISSAIAQPILVGGRTARVSASIGVAAAAPGTELETLIHWADLAMYAAKTNGSGGIECVDPQLLAGEPSRVLFEQQLSEAAEAGQLVVHYQPIVSLADEECVGVEALVRWRHPERGLLLPGEFVAVAERTGAIVDIGAFVLNQACRDLAAWERKNGRKLDLYVNVAGRQLVDGHLVDTVGAALAASGLAAGRLVLELTESTLLHSPAIEDRLEALAGLGVKVAIDDFGTGYASLTTLSSLPIDTVKIDRSFVARLLDSPTDQAVVSSIIEMAARLGLHSIAEGVEREEQRQLLGTIGAQSVQGFLYRPPAEAEEVLRWLAAPASLRRSRIEACAPQSASLNVVPGDVVNG